MWLWSAVLPLSWALALSLRMLPWQIGLFRRDVFRRTQDDDTQRWWRWRSLGLPVEEVLVLGPAGDDQIHYRGLMNDTPLPTPMARSKAAVPSLNCPVILSQSAERAPALAQHLARLVFEQTGILERWPRLRAIVWAGDEIELAAFEKVLGSHGTELPKVCLPLQDLADLDELIDIFNQECRHAEDWLLCAGVVSVQGAEAATPPGEGGFLWVVSRQGRQLLHRGEYLSGETDDPPAELSAQMQRYAGLQAPPTCLAMDQASQQAFMAGGWSAIEHQLEAHWGELAHLAPFIGMSLALLHAKEAGQPCGWLSQDADKRLAIGVAKPHGKG
ncbi:hypothetical protein [Pseudomonas sp. D1-2]|uniref:hypothetical protein n=1 Tax=unclassified Pseudomonas TaxID=196821 RepID=UPI003DA914AB